MIHKLVTDALLTCCRTEAELLQLRQEMEAGNMAAAWSIQDNLAREKTGFRCSTCGRFFPALEIFHNGQPIDPKAISKPIGTLRKYKKSCDVFLGDHYYATNKKTLLRFEIAGDGSAVQTDEWPIMTGVYQVALSPAERYIATETFGHTIAVIDAETRQTIAKKQKLNLNGAYRLTDNGEFLYFQDHAIRCWHFLENREELLWQMPEAEIASGRHIYCADLLALDRERTLIRFGGAVSDLAVILRGITPIRELKLPAAQPHTLSYQPRLDRFTLATQEKVLVCDSGFRQLDEFPYPNILTRQDGGGIFLIKEFDGKPLKHAHLSPDGKWVLLDFFTYLLLMDRETGALRYCVYSHTGTTSTQSGFVDSKHLWYNWGGSTCVMDI